MVWSVGFEPTRATSYTQRPVPILDYESSGRSAYSTHDHNYIVHSYYSYVKSSTINTLYWGNAMIYKSRLDGTEVEISVQPDKKYGILLSGGFDSAVLLYMILKAYPEIDLRAFTIPKEDGAMNYSPKVVDYINQKLNTNIPQPIAVGNLSLHHRVQTHAATHDMVANHGVTLIFNGINKNPPELEPEDGAPDRSLLSAIDARKIYYPFFDLYKTHIVDFMFQLGIEELMNLTHSCTEMPEGRCGKCLQCGQRAWAFSTLVQNDTGTL